MSILKTGCDQNKVKMVADYTQCPPINCTCMTSTRDYLLQ